MNYLSSKLIATAVITLAVSGCATPKFNYRAPAIDISEPPLNEIVQRAVGEEMLKQGKYALVDMLSVETSVMPHWGVTVNPGLFKRVGSDESANYYELGGRGGDSGSIDKSWVVDPLKVLMIKKDDASICIVTVFNATSCSNKDKQNYKEERRNVVYEDTIQQTLIYSGRIGSRIKFGYREFSNNLARPAFSNDVEYDLLESSIIGYKGAQIEVIEATNQHIKYKVLQNFNKAIGPSVPNQPTAPNDQKPAIKTLKETRSDFFRFPVS
jgi:hypothetical protein